MNSMKISNKIVLLMVFISSGILVPVILTAKDKPEAGFVQGIKGRGLSMYLAGTKAQEKIAVASSEGDPEVSFVFHSKSAKRAPRKIPCVLFCAGDKGVTKLIEVITRDLEFTDQFTIDVRHCKKLENRSSSQEDLKKIFEEGYDIALYIFSAGEKTKDGSEKIYFNGYQTASGEGKKGPSNSVLFEKIGNFKKDSVVTHGHALSSNLLTILTGSPGLCMHTIAYCVETPDSIKKPVAVKRKDIYIGDYAGFIATPIATGPGVKIAPSFHTQAPYVFFTRLTQRNARLQMRNLHSKYEETCFSFPGINMNMALSPNGVSAVVCLSGGKGNTELFHYDQRVCNKVGRKVFEQLTHNHGNNVSPCYLASGDIIFCSDFEMGYGHPQIYYLDRKKNKTMRLTNGAGYCADPSYCAANNSVIYTRLIAGKFQLFSVCLDSFRKKDRARLDEHQLTFCQGDKTAPQWDETGNYAVFLYEFTDAMQNKKSQIALLNLHSGIIRIVTFSPELKSFPTITSRILYQG